MPLLEYCRNIRGGCGIKKRRVGSGSNVGRLWFYLNWSLKHWQLKKPGFRKAKGNSFSNPPQLILKNSGGWAGKREKKIIKLRKRTRFPRSNCSQPPHLHNTVRRKVRAFVSRIAATISFPFPFLFLVAFSLLCFSFLLGSKEFACGCRRGF